MKSFERCGSAVLPGWLAGISTGGLYELISKLEKSANSLKK
jgi:hypothetical protein